MKNKKVKDFLLTPLFAILGRSGGFLIPILIAIFYGANPETDVFFLIVGITTFLTGFFSRYFESLIPLWCSLQKNPEKESASVHASLVLIYGVAGLFFGFLLIFLKPILIHSTGIQPEYIHLGVRIYLELLPVLILGVWLSMTESIFNRYKAFWFPALAPLIRSIVVIFIMVFGYKKWGIHALTWGYVAGELFRTVLTLVLIRIVTPFRFRLDLKEIKPQAKTILAIGAFQILGLLAVDIQPLIDQWFASWLPQGSLSLLNYGDRIMLVPEQLFLIGFVQIFLTYWTDNYQSMQKPAFLKRIRRDISIVLAAAALALTPVWFLRHWLVELAFHKSQLDLAQRQVLGDLLGWLLVGFSPHVVNLLYIRVLFVIGRMKYYFAYAGIQLGLKILLTYFLLPVYQVNGIAMASLVSASVTVLWLHWKIEKMILPLPGTHG